MAQHHRPAGGRAALRQLLRGAGPGFTICLAVGVAVACSTYLSGVITWLCVVFLFLMGECPALCPARSRTGPARVAGRVESMVRLFTRKVPAGAMDSTAAEVHGHLFRRSSPAAEPVHGLFPDVNRYDFSGLVANGFNVPVVEPARSCAVPGGLPAAVAGAGVLPGRGCARWQRGEGPRDATALCRGASRSFLPGGGEGIFSLAPGRNEPNDPRHKAVGFRMPRPCAVVPHARLYQGREKEVFLPRPSRNEPNDPRLKAVDSGCHGLGPWCLTLLREGRGSFLLPR